VTIAAGILCQDGMVICADTEETITEERKGPQGKIRIVQHYAMPVAGGEQKFDWTIGIAGAGHSDWVAVFNDGLSREVMDKFNPRRNPTHAELQQLLEAYAQQFFERYIRNYAENPEHRPQVQIVLLMQHHGGVLFRDMFRINDNLVLGDNFRGYVAIGTGSPVFHHLADSLLLNASYSARQTASIAAYIMDRVKSEVRGCGGNTHIVIIEGDCSYKSIPTTRVKELEIYHAGVEFKMNEALAKELIKELP